MKLLIAESSGFSLCALELLRKHAEVAAADLDRAALVKTIGAFDAVWVRLRHRLDAELLAAAPRLKLIATNATGLTHIDLEETRRRGIEVVSLAGEAEFLRDVRATAELTIGLMLALARKIPAAVCHSAAGGWNRDAFIGRELHRKTIGIVGLGRLGRMVAQYLRPFEAAVLACDARARGGAEELAAPLVSFDNLLARSDIVTVHVDLNQSTHRMFDRGAFAQMKDGALLVNTSRGEVIDEDALLAALQSGRLAGAALDVLADEHRLPESRPLIEYARGHDNLILTPHIGGNTHESREKTEMFLARKLAGRLEALRAMELARQR